MTRQDPLREALDALPREIPPQRDLWPGIEARLGAQDAAPEAAAAPRRDPASPRRWPRRLPRLLPHSLPHRLPAGGRPALAVLAAAACVAVIVIAVRRPAQSPPRHPSGAPAPAAEAPAWPAGALAALDDGYAQVHAGALDVLAARCDGREAAGCAALRSGLAEVDRSVQELRRALAAAPAGDPWLADRLEHTLGRARDLSRLAGSLL